MMVVCVIVYSFIYFYVVLPSDAASSRQQERSPNKAASTQDGGLRHTTALLDDIERNSGSLQVAQCSMTLL